MICHQYRCVFVHIPKNAGQSVERVFLELLGLRWETRAPLLLRFNPYPELGPSHLSHLRAAEYVRCRYLSQELFDGYFKFAFVRNPWDRMVSIYKWYEYHRICGFARFVAREFPKHLWTDERWFVGPQSEFLCDEHGELLVDYVGRYEELQAGFDHVCRELGLPPITLPHVNRSGQKGEVNRAERTVARELRKAASYPWWLLRGRGQFGKRDYRSYYDDETRERVAELYRSDIELFGYTF